MQLIDRTELVDTDAGAIPIRTLRWDFTEEVRRGSLLLDAQIGPDWHNDLDLETLDLKSGDVCILGQLAMSRFLQQLVEKEENDNSDTDERCDCGCERRFEYGDVVRLLAVNTDDDNWRCHETGHPATHGFFVDEAEVERLIKFYNRDDRENLRDHVWEQLTWAWMDEIYDRRQAEQAAKLLADEASQPALINQ